MRYYSISMRLLWGVWTALFVVLAVPFFYFSFLLEKDLHQDAYERAVSSLNSVEWVLSQRRFSGPAELDAWTEDYGAVTGERVSYIVGDRLSADSDIAFADLKGTEAHSARPEVLEALKEGLSIKMRYSSTLKQMFIYAAKPTKQLRGVPPGVIRLAIPASKLSAHVSDARWGLFVVFLAALVMGGILCLLVIKALMRNINELSATAKKIGEGNYSARMYEARGQELSPLVAAINGMAQNIETQLEALDERNSRLEALFEALHEGVVVMDMDGHVLSANVAAGRMFPALFAWDGRDHPLTIMEAAMLPALQDAVDELHTGEETQEGTFSRSGAQGRALRELVLENDDGLKLETVLTIFGEGASRGILAVFRDVSGKERLERLRRDFVANVSHELKTPLTSIKGYSEALLDMEGKNGAVGEKSSSASDPAAQRRLFLEIIAKNAEHMDKIVQGLLKLASTEHNVETAALERMDIIPLLREAVQNKSILAKERDLLLCVPEISGPVTAVVMPDGLREVFHNLLDNALKYADPGTSIDIGLKETASELIVSVKNVGPQIPEDLHERIFERFYRLDRDGNQRKSGSAGLGLAICKRTLMGYGGRIWVENFEKGVVFHVALRRREGV